MCFFATSVALMVGAFITENSSYGTAAERAFAERKPLVVFVGVKSRAIDGAVTVQVPSLEGYDKMTIVVSKPGAEWLEWASTLSADGTDAEIIRAIGSSPGGAIDALDEVNLVRAARGLPPFIKDDGLTQGAMSAAIYRAERRLSGHTPNDFRHLPDGANASAAGCAAWSPDLGWGSCCTYDNRRYAGAAYVVGNDGRRYMHLFVR